MGQQGQDAALRTKIAKTKINIRRDRIQRAASKRGHRDSTTDKITTGRRAASGLPGIAQTWPARQRP
jgi:hypothetical protein